MGSKPECIIPPSLILPFNHCLEQPEVICGLRMEHFVDPRTDGEPSAHENLQTRTDEDHIPWTEFYF